MIDPNLDTLLTADPEALTWFALLAYGSGYDAASGCALPPIADDRIAALMRATALAWDARQRLAAPRRPAWLESLIAEWSGVAPWPEEAR